MKREKNRRKSIMAILFAVMMITSVFATIAPVSANPSQPPEIVTVEANFHLYGEMYRFSGLGWGSLELEFGMNSETLATGSIDFPLFEEPTSSGVLESVSVSGAGWNIIDTNFTVPFQLRVGENASLYLKLYAGAIRTVIDFSDDIRFVGSVLPEGKEGLTLTSITVPDSYQFRFIDENTIFEAFGTDGADQRTVTTIAPDTAILSFKLVRSSVLMDPMPRLSISPDPNPLVYDFAYAQISGTENVVVIAEAEIDTWAEIDKELDALIANVSAAGMPNIIKQRLIDKLEYAKELKDNAKEECEAGNFEAATKKLCVAKSQVESFASMVRITRRISEEDKASFLADSTEIIVKIDELIEYIETEHKC